MFCVHMNLIIYISVHIIFKFPGMFLFWFLVDISNSLMSLNMVFLSYWKEICLYYTCIRNDFQIGKRLIWCCGKSQNKKKRIHLFLYLLMTINLLKNLDISNSPSETLSCNWITGILDPKCAATFVMPQRLLE